MSDEKKNEQILISADVALPYRYSAGRYGSRFLRGLKQRKIIASRCGGCGMTLVPPRAVCAGCFGEMKEFVELEPTGSLTAYTQVTFPFIDPFTGEKRPIPYCYGMIRFDGADNTFQYFLEEKDIAKIHVGLRLRAVFRTRREGNIRDILYFRTERARGKGSPNSRKKKRR